MVIQAPVPHSYGRSVAERSAAIVDRTLGARSTFTIRPVRATDRRALSDFYAGLSPASRYMRFMGFSAGIDELRARTFCTPDHVHEEGFVAVLDKASPEQIVGHLCLQPYGTRKLELAVAVGDGFQGQGIGRQLITAAISWAEHQGYEAIAATAFADNWRVLRLLSSAGHPAHVIPAGGGTVDVLIPLRAALD